MTDDLLRRILDKASGEMTLAMVGLFNWTEPLLNPQLPRLVEIVNSYGVWSGISSNLNLLKDPEALMRANPSWIRVSVSGYRQEIYERGHRNGQIEHVKQNMRRLADAKRTTNATTEFELFFHRYLDNEDDEAPMKQYAEDLGYRFLTGWAYMMPLEKVLTYADPSQPETPLTDEDRIIMDRLALRTNAMLDVCSRHKLTSCSLQDEFLALNVRGDVYLCCASSGRAKNMIGNFLELSFDEIQRRKYAHSLCGKCLQRGLPVYLNQIDPAFDDIGLHARAEFRSQRSLVS
jgi:MoaA/NifB/PqqE/SkfB family radical SAM enzyme